jgi:hypothetical protein
MNFVHPANFPSERITDPQINVQEVFLSSVEEFIEFQLIQNKLLGGRIIDLRSEIKSQDKKGKVIPDPKARPDSNLLHKTIRFQPLGVWCRSV